MTVSNSAAWITVAKGYPFEIKSAPLWSPEENEILVRNYAVAANPVDGSLQKGAWWPFDYPTILGQDVAGQVAAVGPKVARFKVGDRVVGHAVGMATMRNQDNGFQQYTILQSHMASELPPNVSFERAAVIPLACSTAACGLFQEAPFLNLQYPTEPRAMPTGKTLLVWGGASSVGSNAIQLAVAAGYDVITTASPRNFTYVKDLGASEVFDYHKETIAQDLVNALIDKTIAGAFDAIGGPATTICVDVVNRSNGHKAVTTTKGGFAPLEGITIKNMFGTTLKDNAVGNAVYENYLPRALKAGTFVPAPEPLVMGKDLESIQAAVDSCAQGLSAQKAVVSL